ncbi:MAG: MarR family transcriptional regulator, partial [Bacteroidales bacterium]|nr:MarR family transcriptional regulator [Bacteroidales bacterium]
MEGYDVDFFEIHYLFRDLIRAFMKRINEQGEEAIRITHEQFGFLYAISKNKNDVIQQDMAEFMKKDKSVILRTIDSLEEKNLIRRVVSK